MTNWDSRFMHIARSVALWSKDPSRKVSAIAVKDRRVLSTGYNGFPRGVADTEERLNNRELKYKFIVHGEMNCILNAAREGVSLEGATIYVTRLPVCGDCAKAIAQCGIKRVVMESTSFADLDKKWVESYESTSKVIFDECGIEITILSD